MELNILSIKNEEKGKVKLPEQFKETVREDVIRRVVLVLQANQRQQYGATVHAGLRASAEVSRRRRDYRGSYGKGISRVPRKVLTRRGTQFFWVGASAPGTVSGRRAHPPKALKDWSRKVNKKENRKAIRSALAATISKEIVEKRGHSIPKNFPFVIETKIEEVKTSKTASAILNAVGLTEDMARGSKKKVRSGKGKNRGRKYKKSKGPLLVVSGDCALMKSAKNLAGVDITEINALNAELLAPGAQPGRLTIFTEKALEEMQKNKMFM